MNFKIPYATIAGIAALATWGGASAASATLADFGSGAVFESFESQGLIAGVPSLSFGGNTLTSDDTISVAESVSCNGFCISNSSGTGFIDILLGAPALRAGASTGLDASNGTWSVSVDFFDESDSLLGNVSISGAGFGGFFGWETDSNLIKRIRITDTGLPQFILLVDDLVTESPSPVPIPAALWLLGSAIGGLGIFRRNSA